MGPLLAAGHNSKMNVSQGFMIPSMLLLSCFSDSLIGKKTDGYPCVKDLLESSNQLAFVAESESRVQLRCTCMMLTKGLPSYDVNV